MRGWTKALLLAVVLAAAAGACGRADHLTSPDDGRTPSADLAPLPDGGLAPLDEPPPPPADSTGRWGGGLGSGT